MSRFRYVSFALLILGVGVALWFVWFSGEESRHGLDAFIPGKDAARNRHDTDYPKTLSEEQFDPRFIILSAADRTKIPVADRFDSPMGTESGGFVYDAQPFHEMNEEMGGMHEGQDLNGIGGKNTDEGYPVYAGGRGMVVFVGTPSADWGNVIVLAHRLPGGEIIQTLYGHVNNPSVALGDIVPRGKKIAEVGTADGLYWAHLHYEAMISSFNEAGAPGYVKQDTNRFDPSELNKMIGKEALSTMRNDIFLTLEHIEIERNRQRLFQTIGIKDTSAQGGDQSESSTTHNENSSLKKK